LIELLVVIAISPFWRNASAGAAKAKAKANQTTCLNNLKQLGLGTLMYCSDNDDKFPGWASNGAGSMRKTGFTGAGPRHYAETDLRLRSIRVHCAATGAGTADTNASIFLCPMDRTANSRTIYNYSYAFNSIAKDKGMASGHDSAGIYPFSSHEFAVPLTK